jgi:hypothetical protein
MSKVWASAEVSIDGIIVSVVMALGGVIATRYNV